MTLDIKATIKISNIILSFLCAVTIWNLTNLFIIRNRKEKNIRLERLNSEASYNVTVEVYFRD
jgi:hypothetical protein